MKKKNKTPLHYAAEKNSKEIGELLLLKGAKINKSDKQPQITKNCCLLISSIINKGNLIKRIKLHFIMQQGEIQKRF